MKTLLITLASSHFGWALALIFLGEDFWQLPWLIAMMCVCTLINISAKGVNND